ncbi:terminase [Cellulosimicrobium sp. E-16]|uniref:terminase n=1 Tax=Cellulosimicrobium sp. E-16 TaxID=3404049 RepID=UPI003CF2B398
MEKPTTPRGLGAAGKRLWAAVSGDFELAEHELALLDEAARVRDRIAELRDEVARNGVMISSSQGKRLHPGIAEVRQQQLALARLLATLSVPGLEDDNLPSARRVRGVYPMGRAS